MWTKYKRKVTIEARPYVCGEDLSHVMVANGDTPTEGGMICRSVSNHKIQWYVDPKLFSESYEIQDS